MKALEFSSRRFVNAAILRKLVDEGENLRPLHAGPIPLTYLLNDLIGGEAVFSFAFRTFKNHHYYFKVRWKPRWSGWSKF
jgi:hypothetical protein